MEKIFWEILAASALVITMEQFFSAFLKKKIVGWKYTGMWIFFFLYHMSIMGLVKGYLATMTGNVIALAIICWFSYQTTFAINIMMILLAISLSGISEGVIAIFILLVQGDLTGNLYLYSVMGKIVFWICIRILCLLCKGKVEGVQKKGYGIFLIIIANVNIWVLVGNLTLSIHAEGDLVKIWSGIITFMLLLVDMIALKLYLIYQEKVEEKSMKQLYAEQVRMYDEELHEKQKTIDGVRRTRHDIKNHMIYLQELLAENPDEAKKFLKEYLGENIDNKSELSKSGNLAVDALINYKNIIAREKGITIHLESRIPAELPYESTDLSIILGNLLDNAMEATEKLENEKDIFVSLLYQKEKMLIKVQNPYTGDLKKDRAGNYISEKKDRENHGIGLKSVRKVVEKYEGVMEIHTEDQTFEVYVIL